MQGVQEGAREEMGRRISKGIWRRIGRETRRGGFGPSRSSSPPSAAPLYERGSVHPTCYPVLSLSSPLVVPLSLLLLIILPPLAAILIHETWY
jgi:hypothetical protein